MPRNYPRKLRVASEMQRVLNTLLCNEVKDPRLTGITVSSVELSGDISVAKIGFSTLDPEEDIAPIIEGLMTASGFLRSRVGQTLDMRRAPELRFEHDDGARQGMEMSRLIDEIVAHDRLTATHDNDDD